MTLLSGTVGAHQLQLHSLRMRILAQPAALLPCPGELQAARLCTNFVCSALQVSLTAASA